MSISEKFQQAKSSIQGGAQSFLIANIIISAGGLLAHGASYAFQNKEGFDMGMEVSYHTGSDYSLKNRFVTAYCFDTPESQKQYTFYDGDRASKDTYLASPYATYGTIGAATLLGLLAGYKCKEK